MVQPMVPNKKTWNAPALNALDARPLGGGPTSVIPELSSASPYSTATLPLPS